MTLEKETDDNFLEAVLANLANPEAGDWKSLSAIVSNESLQAKLWHRFEAYDDNLSELCLDFFCANPKLARPRGSALEYAALQCGICTPGFLVAAKALLERSPDPSETEVRFWLAGNLCRCTGYDKIIQAVLDTATELKEA